MGGYGVDETVTNQLFSLIEGQNGLQWEEHLPPMPTKRDCPIAFSHAHFLVVAGGTTEKNSYLRTCEVLNTNLMQWFTSVSLPEPLGNASVTLCGDNVFILGGWYSLDTPTRSVLTCKVENLLRSSVADQVWNRIADLPVLMSTGVAYQDHLLAFGGVDFMNKSVNDVYKYDWTFNSWRVVGCMLMPRGRAFATMLPPHRVLVAGGHRGCYLNKMYEVEVATICSRPPT